MIQSMSTLSTQEQMRLWTLTVHLKQVQQNLRYVDYRQAEHDCAMLAGQLSAVYSPQELAEFSFIAIPRGGLIVLGMLAYVLGLRPEQLQSYSPSSASPLCIVDDCSLTGLRLAQAINQTNSEHIVFAHLYSHPSLRQAILARESRVRQCLAAQDLGELAQQTSGETSDAAQSASWQTLLGDGRYWVGPTEVVAFAWGEPNKNTLNPFTGRLESGWRLVPPHKCLKNRSELGLPPRIVQAVNWRVPEAVVTGWFDGVLWLLQTETEQAYKLEGLAADAWRALAVYGSLDAALDFLQACYHAEPAALREDLGAVIQHLVDAKLIEKIDF